MEIKKILIIEDCLITGRLIAHHLSREDYETLQIHDGTEAWNHLQTSQPDLIVLDENLPGISGGKLLLKIRAVPELKHIPIIFASGCNEDSFKKTVFQNGANDYLTKPFQGKDIICRVNHQIHIASLQRELTKRKAYLHAIIDNTVEAIVIIDECGKVEFFNLEAERIFGWRASEITGQNINLLIPDSVRVEDDDQARFDIFQGEAKTINRTKGVCKNGQIFPMEMRIRKAYVEGRWLFVAILRDITNQVLSENEQIQHEIQLEAVVRDQSEKLRYSDSLLKNFTWSASHDLQEPLRKIITFANRFRDRSGKALDEQGLRDIQRIVETGERMRDIIDAQLLFSLLDDPEQQFIRVDLQQVIENVTKDIELAIAETGAHITHGPLPKLLAKRFQMRQLFFNLLLNAITFCEKDVRPEIRVESRSAGEDWLEIVVQDNGIGFDGKYSEQIFTPYKRLHAGDQFPGSGMGLAICRNVASHHGGRIYARSTPGQGSTFTVYLPTKLPTGYLSSATDPVRSFCA
ncbi:MAG: response regulator [Nitrospinae bacterium]|nr:response regulator [Nitrospinota bacterium]MBL7021499.1 response regulator [Nitrospinaceae bacterium]